MNDGRTRWGLVALTFIIGLFAAAQFAKISLTLNTLIVVYNQPLHIAALLVSLVGVIGIVFGVMAGGWTARIGLRRTMIGAIFLGALVSAAQITLPPLPILFALRGIEGISHLALVVAAPPLMAAFANDRDRPIVMAIWAMFFGVAFALAARGIPAIVEWGGLALLFATHGAGLALLGIVFWLCVPKAFGLPTQANSVGFLALHRQIYATARLSAPALGFVFYTVLFIAAVTFLPQLVILPNLGETLPLISLAGTLFAGRLAQSMRAERVSILGFIGTALFSVGLLIGWDLAVYPLFLTMGLVPGAQFAMIPSLNDSIADRSRATGAIAQMGNVGTVCGTPIFALLLTGFGPAAPIWAMVIVSVIGAVVVAGLWRRCL